MVYQSVRLPKHFPDGTKFVIESHPVRAGQRQVFSRYLEFPDGTFFPLPSRAPRNLAGKLRQPTRLRRKVAARAASKSPA